ncbi:hypothetical protein GLOIN_2v1882540 [Rhizophagus clarus]|uniref:BTB domain-containing protein n=1 Tax=Rhizophagus clarus TaxID=94130 RepID=A0A8H3LYJ3_9GLOM|nr:hypothetical protein GLOIN_2v1882540 [Rhizophagus clarus]
MSAEFFSKLSQNYVELLKDDEYYDITIEVGENPNVKIFRAHMSILCYRSSYFRRALTSSKKRDNIKFPNISPDIFQIILRYIYGGILSLNGQETSDFLKVLAAADELLLQELVDYLQKYLIENKSEWMKENFEFTQQISLRSNNLVELQQFCADFIAKSPEKIFKTLCFTSISEKFLVSLIKRDDLQMKEIEVWEHVLKWGLAQNSTFNPDPDTWSDDDFETMKNTLQHCLPLVRFFSLSSKEFSHKVRPYKKLLDKQLYEVLLNSYLDSDREPTEDISLPRSIGTDEIIDSKIVNLNIVSIISRWIDKVDVNCKFSHLRELYLPYKFKLLIRGSRDGFTPKKFHQLCDNKHNTVTFIKVKDSKEILGGYNPIIWMNSNSWGKAQNSFIFSFKSKDSFKDSILSIVRNKSNALNYHPENGPSFGRDIMIYTEDSDNINFDRTYCNKVCYEKSIREAIVFSIEDYEVFQIIGDDLQMKEIEIWEYVLKWSFAQNLDLVTDPGVWTDDDIKTMENTLQHCLPFVRLFSLSSKEFSDKIRPYQKLLSRQFYEELLNSHLEPYYEPDGILLPKNIKIDGIIDLKIRIVFTIRLPIRGSLDRFIPKKFHELCDNKHNTVTFIKIKNSEEILGGCNQIIWMNSNSWGETQDSLYFPLK